MNDNKDKKQHNEEIETNDSELENKEVIEEKELTEVEKLKIELEQVKKEKESLQKELTLLNYKISENNQNYINKLKEKQEEMQKILSEKQEEMVALNNQKLEEFKTKLFTKDILDLIDTIEQFNKIINIPNDNQLVQNFLFGFKMFSNMFSNALSNMGIEKIDINIGDEPNYETTEVVEKIQNSDLESGKIIEVVSNGYKYKDSVIKFAKVKVKE